MIHHNGDDDIPPHPFRYEYQPTPQATLAEEEVVENAVEELHVAQENVEHAENDKQLEEAENQREEAVERLAAAEEQLDAADDVLADVQTLAASTHEPDDIREEKLKKLRIR